MQKEIINRLEKEFKSFGCEVSANALMSEYTSFKIGGPADILITTCDIDEIRKILEVASKENVPITFMGNGTNMLVSDKGIRGIVVRISDNKSPEIVGKDEIVTSAGISLKELCRFARDNGLSGLEFAFGIPGTVGGGLFMNAGAYGGQMADVVVWAKAILPNGEIETVSVDKMNLGYRHSIFMDQKAIIIEAGFKLKVDNIGYITFCMEDFMRRRRKKQPLEFPSGGSFFKRPPNNFAGTLIEKSGLKGHKIGGAQVSEKHAGFVVNCGGATCDDVQALGKYVRDTVYQKYGVELEREVLYFGDEEEA